MVLQRHIITVQSKWECQPAAPPPGSDAICCGLGGEREDFSGCRQELKQGDQLRHYWCVVCKQLCCASCVIATAEEHISSDFVRGSERVSSADVLCNKHREECHLYNILPRDNQNGPTRWEDLLADQNKPEKTDLERAPIGRDVPAYACKNAADEGDPATNIHWFKVILKKASQDEWLVCNEFLDVEYERIT